MSHQVDVLVVDDEVEIVGLISEMLIDEGYSVQTATSGTEALDAVATWQPTLLLLDYTLPGMSGGDVVQQLQARGHTTTIVIMSASTLAARMQIPGTVSFLEKPFDLDALLACIQRYVEPRTSDED